MRILRTLAVLILVHFTCVPQISAQVNFFAENAQWYYAFKTPGLFQSRGYTKYHYVRDSLIAGVDVHIIERTTYLVDYDDPTIPLDTFRFNPVYVTQWGDSILYYTGEDFQILWRTNPQEGDIFQFDKNDFQVYTMHIDSVIPAVVDGQDVMKIWVDGDLTYSWGDRELIYDRFGPVHGFFYYVCWGSFDCYNADLCKYVSDETGEVRFDGPYCDNLTSGISEPLLFSPLRIFPNPSPGICSVTLTQDHGDSMKIEIYTLSGTLMHSATSQSSDIQFDLTTHDAGVYVCRVYSADQVWVSKLILL